MIENIRAGFRFWWQSDNGNYRHVCFPPSISASDMANAFVFSGSRGEFRDSAVLTNNNLVFEFHSVPNDGDHWIAAAFTVMRLKNRRDSNPVNIRPPMQSYNRRYFPVDCGGNGGGFYSGSVVCIHHAIRG